MKQNKFVLGSYERIGGKEYNRRTNRGPTTCPSSEVKIIPSK
jgi:hypothetical protein